jgi:serine phosphatase RsbU (regulator of sigma subunit)
MKKVFFIYLIFFCCGFTFSQSGMMDSLKIALKNAKHDTTRCKILFQMIEAESNDSIWPLLNEKLNKLSENNLKNVSSELKKVYLTYFALSINNRGFFFMQNGKIQNAYEQYFKALSIYEELNDKNGIATLLCNLGYLYRQDGQIKKAINSYHNALKIQIEIDNKLGIATSYNNIGFIFDNQGEYIKALEYYNRSLSIYKVINDKDGIANCYGNISYIYKTYGVPNCKKSKKECRDLGFINAIDFLNRAIKIQEDINDKDGLASSLNILGGIYDNFGDPSCTSTNDCYLISKEKAYRYYKKALEIRLGINNLLGITQSYNSLAEYMLKYNKLQMALEFATKCINCAKELNSPERIKDAALTLKKIYEKQKRYHEALEMYQLYIVMRDSTINTETKKIAIKKGFQIEYEKKVTADSVLASEEKKVTTAQLKQEKTQRFALYGGILLVGLFGAFMFNRFKVTKKQNHVIQLQKTALQKQKELVEEHQKETLDSIHYAKRIQTALIANSDFVTQNIPNNFIYFNPKDIVSGDFYWATKHNNKFYLAVCDSTGHGVPGAFMSLLNMGFLSEAIKEKNIEKPNEIFNYVRERLISTISNGGQKDGMDGILICIDMSLPAEPTTIAYAAANNEPILIRDNQIIELPKDRMPVGKGEKTESFSLHSVDLRVGDGFYLYTDGYADQFGGPKGKKYKYKKLNELLLSFKSRTLNEQKEILELEFTDWKGNQEQVDDVLVIGIRI